MLEDGKADSRKRRRSFHGHEDLNRSGFVPRTTRQDRHGVRAVSPAPMNSHTATASFKLTDDKWMFEKTGGRERERETRERGGRERDRDRQPDSQTEIETETDRQTDKRTETETDRQTDKRTETDRQPARQRQRQTDRQTDRDRQTNGQRQTDRQTARQR